MDLPFCGSFVAAVSPSSLPSLLALVVASVLAGLSQLDLTGLLVGGWGGNLGTAALIVVVGYRRMIKATNGFVSAFHKEEEITVASKPSEV